MFNGLCEQKFQVVQNFLPHLPKPVRTKLSVCKIKKLKLFFVNTVTLIATKIVFACFKKAGSERDNEK